MTQKRILITRHGIAPQNPETGGSIDKLFPESVTNLYNKGADFSDYIVLNDVVPERTFLDHSNKKRTKDTGRAILIGAFALAPKEGGFVPRSQEDLDRFGYDGIEMKEDARLDYGNFMFNEDIIKAEGQEGYMKRWTENPFAKTMEGKTITPFVYAIQVGRDYIKDAIRKATEGDKDLGIAATHGGSNVDPIVMALLDTKRLEDIGGMFQMEDNAQLVIDQSRGGVYTARLERDGVDYKVDLDSVFSI
ncbi:hypothetical protein HYX17_05555 [Candidatus Woesearchaeota archaeon]|nr:hypothetical protein [Candidatus Woesearchaeota archaeon]